MSFEHAPWRVYAEIFARDALLVMFFGSFLLIWWKGDNPIYARAVDSGGHLIVWPAIGLWGLWMSKRVGSFVIGAAFAVFASSIYEATWWFSAEAYFPNGQLDGYISLGCLVGAGILIFYQWGFFRFFSLWRFGVTYAFFLFFLGLWVYSGFQMTDYPGHTVYYHDPVTNLLEVLSWYLWLALSSNWVVGGAGGSVNVSTHEAEAVGPALLTNPKS